MKFIVPGKPKGKGRPRFTRQGHCYTPKTTADYEAMILWRYLNADKSGPLISAPVMMIIKAYFKPPSKLKAAEKRKAIADGWPHTSKPDADNIAKIVCDALNGHAWVDDSQVCNLLVQKSISDDPRLEIEIQYIHS